MLKYEAGEVADGIVTGVESYGFFVDVDDGNKGLVHISEISEDFVKDINCFVKIGDTIKVEIIEVLDNDQYRLSVKNTCSFNRKYSTIRETSLGFSTLKKCLPIWIEKKLKEIDDNSVKN